MNKLIALWMGERDGDKPWNLNYDSPDHFARMTGRLFESEFWGPFYFHYYLNSEQKFTSADFAKYLFSDRTRFISLFAEFLRLPETRREFGWEECPNCEQGYAIRKVGHRMEGTTDRCQFCDGTGKVLSEWAREEEGESCKEE